MVRRERLAAQLQRCGVSEHGSDPDSPEPVLESQEKAQFTRFGGRGLETCVT